MNKSKSDAVPIIGREEELKKIEHHLLEWGTRCIFFVWGEGGVGKTRLLHEIPGNMNTPFRTNFLAILDFDDDRYRWSENIEVGLARRLDPDSFSSYFAARRTERALKERLNSNQDDKTLFDHRRYRKQAITCFRECFNELAKGQRIVVRLDTTDALKNDITPLTETLNDLILHLDNVLVLIAGRNADELYEKYQKSQQAQVIPLPLNQFTLADSRRYLMEKERVLRSALKSQEYKEKLLILAGGIPIFVDLAIEWAHGPRKPPDWIKKEILLSHLKSLYEKAKQNDIDAQKQLDGLRERFKRAIVEPIAHREYSQDVLILTLSRVYPLDIDGIIELSILDREQVEGVIEQARRLQSVSIKALPDGRIKLHDELQHLVSNYVWKLLGRDQEWDIYDNKRVIAYLTRESDALLGQIHSLKQKESEQSDPVKTLEMYGERSEKEGIFWSMRIERLRRQLLDDVQEGYEVYIGDLKVAENEAYNESYRRRLLKEIEPYSDLESPQSDFQGEELALDQRYEIQIALGKRLTLDASYDKAEQVYRRLLDNAPKNTETYVAALNGRANQLIREGKLGQARQSNDEALQISKQKGLDEWIVRCSIDKGWFHHLIGDLAAADYHYRQALNSSILQGNDERIALILSQRAHIQAILGDRMAVSSVREAIRKWKALADKGETDYFRLGQSYNIAGEIHLEFEEPAKALPYFELSLTIFEQNDVDGMKVDKGEKTFEWMSKARSGRGFAYWQRAGVALRNEENTSAQEDLSLALDDLQWAVKHATDFDRPAILNRLGEVYFLQGQYQETAEVWMRSLREAKDIKDCFTELHSLSDLARLAFYCSIKGFESYLDFKDYYNDYKKRYSPVFFEILRGLFFTYLGHLAFSEEDLGWAVRFYQEGLPLLAHKGTYTPFNIRGQLDFMEREIIPNMSTEFVIELIKGLKQWGERREEDYGAIALMRFREWEEQAISGEKFQEGIYA